MESSPRQISKVDLCLGLTVIGLGAVLAFGLSGISFGAGYDRIGPRFFPYVVAFGLIALGGWFVIEAFTTHHSHEHPAAAAPNAWAPVTYLAVALVLTLFLMERAGFVIACALQFWLVARAFGSRRPLRDAAVGCALALLCFLAFSNGLGLTLPSGILDGIL